jgi:nitroreductase
MNDAPPTSADLWTVMSTATAVRRYRDEPVDDETLGRCLRAASWAPSGGNQQPWRFVVLRSDEARAVVTAAAHQTWAAMKDFYTLPALADGAADPKSRVLRAMAEHMHVGGDAPGLVLFCVQPQAGASKLQQGGSIFPAVQNFLLAARAQGLGAAITLWHGFCDDQLRTLVGIPDDWLIATLVTVGWPRGGHRSVRRKPLSEVAVVDRWDQPWGKTP